MTREFKPMRPTKSTSKLGDFLSTNIDPANTSIEPTTDQAAKVVPFPVVRRAAFIARAFVASREFPDGGHEYLRAIVQRHRARLEKLGIAPERIEADVGELAAIFFGDEGGERAA